MTCQKPSMATNYYFIFFTFGYNYSVFKDFAFSTDNLSICLLSSFFILKISDILPATCSPGNHHFYRVNSGPEREVQTVASPGQ